MTSPPADLDPRRRRLLFRAWHRGMREMDLVLGRFCEAHIATLTDRDIDDLEHLMEVPDPDLYIWVSTPAGGPPASYDTPVFRKLCSFHAAPKDF